MMGLYLKCRKKWLNGKGPSVAPPKRQVQRSVGEDPQKKGETMELRILSSLDDFKDLQRIKSVNKIEENRS